MCYLCGPFLSGLLVMPRVGPSQGRLALYAMMGRKRKGVTIQKEHIKYIELGLITRRKYLAAIRNFVSFFEIDVPQAAEVDSSPTSRCGGIHIFFISG